MKNMIPIALTAALLIGGGIALANSSNDSHQKQAAINHAREIISVEKAKETALQQASGTVKEVELEKDDGKTYYEVEVEQDGKEVEVKVDSTSGKVLKVEQDDRKDRSKVSSKDSGKANSKGNSKEDRRDDDWEDDRWDDDRYDDDRWDDDDDDDDDCDDDDDDDDDDD